MPGIDGKPPLTPTPSVTHYETLYAGAIHSLAVLVADEELDNWFVDAGTNSDEHQTQQEIAYLEQLTLLGKKFQDLVEASKKLHSTGKAWMVVAAQHPKQTQEAEKQKYAKLREDHKVAALEGRALERLEDLRDAINVAVEERTAEHYGQSNVVADVNLQDPLTESDEVRDSTDAASGQSGQSSVYADVNLQDSFTENGEVRGSADAARVCYASEYMASVQTLSATLQELDRHPRDAIDKAVIQVLKEASNRVSTIARKWMRKAATDPVRHPTESQELQTMRKDMHVLSLQRQASNILQELRSARCVGDQASNDQHQASTDQDKTPHADGATSDRGFETTIEPADYMERVSQPSKLEQLLKELKDLKPQQTAENMTKQAITQHPEGFQALPEIANHAGFEISVANEQVSSLRPEGFQAHPEIANHEGSKISASQDHLLSSVSNATVVENIKEPPSDQGSETSEQASHADESEDINEPFSDSDAEQASSDADDSEAEQASPEADELEVKYEDLNEPPSDSEASEQGSDEADELDEFEDFNEPFSDSEDPEQISDHADQCDESSSDAEDPEQSSSDADGHDEPFSDVENPVSSDADD